MFSKVLFVKVKPGNACPVLLHPHKFEILITSFTYDKCYINCIIVDTVFIMFPQTVRNLDNKKLTPEECCFNGITAGTKVLREGMDGCFNMADKFQEIFTNWNRTCDRKFVVCCMRVVEG